MKMRFKNILMVGTSIVGLSIAGLLFTSVPALAWNGGGTITTCENDVRITHVYMGHDAWSGIEGNTQMIGIQVLYSDGTTLNYYSKDVGWLNNDPAARALLQLALHAQTTQSTVSVYRYAPDCQGYDTLGIHKEHWYWGWSGLRIN